METNTSGNWTPTFSGTSANGGNSNSTLPISPSVSGRRESTVRDNVYRRSTTRDTLLELLQQGKLGPKKHPPSGSPGKSDSSANGSEDQQIPKSVIWLKKYTIDIHDAQISLYDESSQSNVLIASKHIHLENGLDETHTTSIVNLNFDYVTGHIAPIGVDVSAGMIWYTHANTSIHHSSNSPGESNPISGPNLSTGAPSSTPDSSLLKQVMEECTLTCSYTQDLSTNAISVDSELSVMNLSTDRHQFYQLLNVLRHVLLAPPTLLRRRSRKLRTRVNPVSNGGNSSGSDGVIASLDKGLGSEISVLPTGSTNSNSSTCPISVANNKKLHLMLAEEMKHRESKAAQAGNFRVTPLALRRIAFRVNGCQWRLRLSPETTGGDHDFVEFRIQGVTGSHVYLGTQTTKMNVNIQWMEMKNLRPGPSSIAFEDAMAVLKPKLLNPDQQSQKGMLSIRAESGPITRVMGQKLRVLDLLEVSIFPEIPYMIVMQLAADFYELMYKFFFEQVAPPPTEAHHENDSEQVLFGRKSSISPPNFKTFKSIHLPSPSSPTSPARTIGNRRKSILPSGYGHARMSVSSPTGNNDDGLGGGNALPSTVSVVTVHGVDSIVLDDEDGSSDGKHELFYFKYVRVGNIRLRINCNGFFVNLKDFDLDLPPYVCQGKLCTVKKLLGKFETHLKWYITKESASSGLSHFKNKFLKWTPNLNPDKEKNNKKKEANKHSAENISSSSLHLIGSSSTSSSSSSTTTTATTITTIAPSLSTNAIHSGTVKSSKDSSITANAQVLFGPYHLSGISTIPPSTPTNGNGNGGSTLTPTSSTTSIF
jgi:hypothetical protein